eukprot:6620309-Ditylum_brightwellii.AAC.1
MGFISCQADPGVWMRAAVKEDGTEYSKYVLCYVDDILCSSEQPSTIMDQLSKMYKLKCRSEKEPELYLGVTIEKFYIHELDEPEKARWSMSSYSYTKKAIEEVELELVQVEKRLQTRVETPLSS